MQFYLVIVCLLLVTCSLLFTYQKKTIPVIILLGAPASGKGTQALKISKKLALPAISTGDLFRENIQTNTSLGQKAKEFINLGKLVPDELVLEMLFERLTKEDAKKGYILDGFPRTIGQAKALEKRLSKKAKITVLNLQVADDTIIKRAAFRQRADDTQEIVKERLRNYHLQTKPLIDFYKKRQVLIEIEGEKNPEEVTQALMQALKK